MSDNAYAFEQIAMQFMPLETKEEPKEEQGNILYLKEERHVISQWLDAECTEFYGEIEDSPGARKFFSNSPLHFYYEDRVDIFERVTWINED